VIPSPRAVRAHRRAVLRAHGRGVLRAALGASWDVVVGAAVLGGIGAQAGRRLVAEVPSHRASVAAATGGWLLAAAAVALVGAALRGLAAAGPVSAQPAALTWIFTGPVDRAGLLAPRFWLSALGAAALGAGVGALLPVPTAPAAAVLIAAAAAGAAVTTAALTLAATAQRRSGRTVRRGGTALLGVAALGGLAAAVTGLAGSPLPAVPAATVLAVVAVLAAALAVVCGVRARSGLGRLDRGTLAAGGALLLGLTTSVAWLDPSLLRGVADERRWRERATVRSRRLRGTGPGVLLRAEVRRLRRQPDRLVAYAGLAVVPYVLAAVADPVWVAVAQVLAGALAVSRLTGGLRTVADQPGLRRALGLDDRGLETLHSIVPALGAVVWAAVTAPAIAAAGDPSLAGTAVAAEPAAGAAVAAAVAALAAAVRGAVRRPPNYDSMVLPDVGFGAAPVGLVAQVLRGADVALLLAGLILAGAPYPVRTAIAVVALAWTLRRTSPPPGPRTGP
jgi:Family of unknown function (DUF6297)